MKNDQTYLIQKDCDSGGMTCSHLLSILGAFTAFIFENLYSHLTLRFGVQGQYCQIAYYYWSQLLLRYCMSAMSQLTGKSSISLKMICFYFEWPYCSLYAYSFLNYYINLLTFNFSNIIYIKFALSLMLIVLDFFYDLSLFLIVNGFLFRIVMNAFVFISLIKYRLNFSQFWLSMRLLLCQFSFFIHPCMFYVFNDNYLIFLFIILLLIFINIISIFR